MKIDIKHPAEFLPGFLTNSIQVEAFKAEQERGLTVVQRNRIEDQKWFNLYVPKQYGGLELSLPQILRIEECLSWADGSTGWVVTLCSGAAWFVGFLDPALAGEVFRMDRVCFAGSGAVTGTAKRTEGGYEINGHWSYATGSLLATVFTVNCHMIENGVPLCHDDGTPVVSAFLLLKDEVIVHSTWSSMGMIATGSHAIEIKGVVVSFNRAFQIKPEKAMLPHPIFQFPFLQLAETTLAVNLSGMACRFVDLCAEIFLKKENPHAKALQQKLQDTRVILNELRSAFYSQVDVSWEELVSQGKIPDGMLHQMSTLSHGLVNRSRDLINALYPFCGLDAANTRNEINRVWRNFHTAGQHALFRGA